MEFTVAIPPRLDVECRPHGSERFPGDPGRPVLFGRRPNAAGAASDDVLSLTVVLTNPVGFPIARHLEIAAEAAVLDPRRGPKRITSLFRTRGGGGPIANPVVLPSGRTVLELEAPSDRVRRAIGAAVDRRVVNLPIRVLMDDPAAESDPLRPHVTYSIARGAWMAA